MDDADFKLSVDSNNTILPEMPISISFTLSPADLLPVMMENDVVTEFDYGTVLHLEKKSRKNSRNLLAGVMPLKNYASRLYAFSHRKSGDSIVQRNVLPVYACFTTEDIHSSRKIDKQRFKEYA